MGWLNLESKVAIVTGGASGIGKAVCEGLAEIGAKVVVADIIEQAAKKTAQELKEKFNEIINLVIKDFEVERILVVKAIDIKKEFYIGVTIDNLKDDVVLIASSAGGVEIEEVAKSNPNAIQKYYLS